MNLLDANSVVSTLGLIGVLGIIFMETGLLIGLVFPGGEVVFLAGIAASQSGSVLLGDAKLSAPLLFALAPIAAITGVSLVIGLVKNMAVRYLSGQIPGSLM